MMFRTPTKPELSDERGFTLIEMVFVFVIFAIMATITLFNFRAFNNKVTYDNLVDDVALRVVQAQKAAISGLINTNLLGVGVKPAYGVFFSGAATVSTTTGASQKKFVYFSDNPLVGAPYNGVIGDKMYNLPTSDTCPITPVLGNECLSVTAFTTGEYISNICYIPMDDPVGHCDTTHDLHIVFTRPFPDASLIVTTPTGTVSSPILARNACVEITSPDASVARKTIVITNLGEVKVYSGNASTTADCTGS